MKTRRWWCALAALACALAAVLALRPGLGLAVGSEPTPTYQTLDELAGKKFAYVNGSVYNQKVEAALDGTTEQFYASLADCVAAVEAGKADAAVQLSYCCQLVVNRKGGTVALLPEGVGAVEECFFFPHGDPLVAQFNQVIEKFEADGTIDALTAKWVSADDSAKTLPAQDWDAPNGTLKFATSGVLEPYSYVGKGGEALGYDVELALLIAKELGYHLKVSTIAMDSIFASVQSGKVDFGGSLTRTDERAQMVDFSKQVMPDYVAVIVAAEGGANAGEAVPEFTSFDELDGKKIGIINGSVYDKICEENLGGDYTFLYYNNMSDMVGALKAGKIDALANDEPSGALVVNENDGIAMMPEAVVQDDYGFFFQKGSPLVAQFNEVLATMEADGTLEALKEKWTGADKAAKTMPTQDWDTPNGTLVMATSCLTEPLSYLEGSQPMGYDLELALLICKELGYGLTFTKSDFSGMLAAVPAGKADFGGGSISITPERQKTVDFTTPTYRGSLRLLVRTVESSGPAAPSFLESLSNSFRKTFIEENRWQLIAGGLGVTVLISVCAGVLGTLLGYGTVLMRRSGATWAGKLVDGYQALMGGVPLVVVLMVLYYVVFGSMDIPGVLVAIMAFTLSFGATAGATMWTAVRSLNSIQEETGLALGFSRQKVFREIIFPQAMTQFLPQLMGQFVSLVKETSIVGYIAVQDLTRASDLIRSRTMDAFFPLIATALIYFLFCRVLARVLGRLAIRLDRSNRPREIEGVER